MEVDADRSLCQIAKRRERVRESRCCRVSREISSAASIITDDEVIQHSFCYGCRFAVDLNGKGLVDATVANHPSFTSASSYDNLKAPILFNCAETDDMFPDSVREAVQMKLDSDSNAPAHDFKVFEK